jgi:hypothetical protein
MSEHTQDGDVSALVAHVEKHLRLLDEALGEIITAEKTDIPLLGKTPRAGVLMAGLLENYYTCAETIFFRVSQFFENSLSVDRWHKDLLEKMTLEIEAVRPRLISDTTFHDLRELMRFRHFKRYYFGTAYDWVRLEELLLRCKRTHSSLIDQIRSFVEFLRILDK